jgi:hypothetical protein
VVLVIDGKRNRVDRGMQPASGGVTIYITEVAMPHGWMSWMGRRDSGLPAFVTP